MKILIIKTEGSKPLELHERHIKQLRAVSEDLTVIATTDDKVIAEHIGDIEVLAGSSRFLPDFKTAKNLKWIHAFSAGINPLMTPEIVNSDIVISNSAGIHATPISEHVIGFMLMFTRKFHISLRKQLKGEWDRREDLTELRDKMVLVVGLGNIGTEVARLSNCFGAKVFAVDAGKKDKPAFVEELRPSEDLGALLPDADFVVSCLPYTKKTRHIFGADLFGAMKPAAYFINIGRGGVVDEEELINALENKKIAGAG